jgi:hypothetical protein
MEWMKTQLDARRSAARGAGGEGGGNSTTGGAAGASYADGVLGWDRAHTQTQGGGRGGGRGGGDTKVSTLASSLADTRIQATYVETMRRLENDKRNLVALGAKIKQEKEFGARAVLPQPLLLHSAVGEGTHV